MRPKTILFAVLALSLMTLTALAEPERIEIKKAAHRAREGAAQTQIRNIDLRKIADPEARKAIGEIMNYLNLQSK